MYRGLNVEVAKGGSYSTFCIEKGKRRVVYVGPDNYENNGADYTDTQSDSRCPSPG